VKGEQRSALVRAARAYAHLGQQEMADALGISTVTYKRRESDDPTYGFSDADLKAVARVTGVPLRLLREGFEPYDADLADVTQRLSQSVVILARALSSR
jgi:transcriptional regulator with XRE-family HTH domain